MNNNYERKGTQSIQVEHTSFVEKQSEFLEHFLIHQPYSQNSSMLLRNRGTRHGVKALRYKI